ncbi:putative bifunctional diguanylate cyclase/phosphodiesterase [Botrimarina mediterranea]|uniref:Phytochrome-like protein cph2 n=1 Tax=Botrimarina mediterranea TaxID=2528022 RepID=A0A518K3X7_9BACT|nr:bifunctional diguanylate cyclase/phosphodiesterase [Botrimarina mediterranea]QDV72501.1 Phytochrome-like protein cph2 [Botrimarina mediterranea]QDV77073.1 Phytochrome-like protein cph2 [Planctomycetes bacterium K2D]
MPADFAAITPSPSGVIPSSGATHGVDSLTGLVNRNEFNELVHANSMTETECGLLTLGLNAFRAVNEAFGLEVGDRVLAQVAKRLTALADRGELVGRLSGDEFGVFQYSGPQPSGSRGLARRIISSLTEPYLIDSQVIHLGVSVGVALSPYDASEATQLTRYSQLAAQHARRDGGNVVRYFEPTMLAVIDSRRELEKDLRRALVRDEFQLLYQPVLQIETGRIIAVEALIRWRHPKLGRVSPADFIPVAEEAGLIGAIGQWALHRACLDAASWSEPLRVAVNVSPLQLKSRDFVGVVQSALQESGLSPSRLELEITESVLLSNGDLALAMLQEVRSQGVTIALDDFGTGYSSINYLRRFPFDKIKIDRSFVSGAQANPEGQALVKMIAALGVSLDVSTTAEGVETIEELNAVRDAGCTQIQGYYLSKPLEVDALLELIGDPSLAQAHDQSRRADHVATSSL